MIVRMKDIGGRDHSLLSQHSFGGAEKNMKDVSQESPYVHRYLKSDLSEYKAGV
jgi:hypothetical protein